MIACVSFARRLIGGADAVSGWLKAGSDFLLIPQMGAVAGAWIAMAWAFSGIYMLRQHPQAETRVAMA